MPLQTIRLEPEQTFVPRNDALIVYVLNVGDGDAIVIQFPGATDRRRYAVVDSYKGRKTLALLQTLGARTALRFLCVTHPHSDHCAGVDRILTDYRPGIEEFWDSGFRFTSNTYNIIIRLVEERMTGDPPTQFVRPTSGFETNESGVRITVLSPSIVLRNRYDSYGVDVNNASVVLKLEYPVHAPSADTWVRDAQDEPALPPGHVAPAQRPEPRSIILSGDAQTDAWSRVVEEFPHLHRDAENWARLIDVRQGTHPLACDVLKVPHHGSKHGLNLELVERMGDRSGAGFSEGPRHLIVSCAALSRKYGFPHLVTQEIMREVRESLASRVGAARTTLDDALGIQYTSQTVDGVDPPLNAGSVAAVFGSEGDPPRLYRFCDGPGDDDSIDLDRARPVPRSFP
jgi:competence protein ComEC